MTETQTVTYKVCDFCMRKVDDFYNKDDNRSIKDSLNYIGYNKYDLCFECHNKILHFLKAEFPRTKSIDTIEIAYKK